MKRFIVLLGVVVCLVVSALIRPCFSQRYRYSAGRRPSQMRDIERRQEQRRLESQRRREEFRKITDDYRDETHQEALGVSAERWAKIKPLMGRIDELRVGPMLKFSTYAFSSGGSSRSGSSVQSGSSRRSAGMGGGSSGGSVRYGFGSGSSGSSGGASYGYSSESSSGSGWGYSIGGGAGPNRDRPVKKRVGDLNLGWTWRRPSDDKGPDELTEGGKICEGLLDALEAEEPDPKAVKEHIEKLRRVREQAKRELAAACKQLREIVAPDQEAKLILMGYLD
ncbi:MAG: hypothetical protein ACYTAS_14550 [Planctomycetota bacterium]|jgi:hypothetical protein